MDFYPKSYHNNPHEYKRLKILNWKQKGVKYDDFDDLYEVYMNTMNCWYCNKEFTNSRQRCLDHDHETGLFRKILCQACNVNDSHLHFEPRLNSFEKRQITMLKHNSKKVKCFFCGKNMLSKCLTRHYKNSHCLIKPQ